MKNINKKIILASTLIALFASCGSSGGGSNHKTDIPHLVKVPDKDKDNINKLTSIDASIIKPITKNQKNPKAFEIKEIDIKMSSDTAYIVKDPINDHKDYSESTSNLDSEQDKQTTFKLENNKQFFYKGELNIHGDNSTGILADNGNKSTRAINDGIINISGNNSIGISGNSTSDITSSNNINVLGKDSTGIYSNGGSVRTDSGILSVQGEGSTGIEIADDSNNSHDNIELQQTIILTGSSTTGIKVENSNIKNALGENINFTDETINSTGMYGTNNSTITNVTDDGGYGKSTYNRLDNAHINIDGSSNTGIQVDYSSHGYNEGIITLNGNNNTGMLADGKDAFAVNHGTIEIKGTNSIAMEAKNGAYVENDGDIILPGKGTNINDWDPTLTAKIMNATETNGNISTDMKKFSDNHGNSAFKIDKNSTFINKGSITFKNK